MSYTPNYNLQTWSTSEITDTFANFVTGTVGDINSNMVKIDTQMKASADAIVAISGYPIRRIFGELSSESYYVATTSFTYTAYVSGNVFALTVDTDSTDTLTLNINSIGMMSVMKYKADGVLYNIAAGDIIAGTINLILFDGTRWVLINQVNAGLVSDKTETSLVGLLKGDGGKFAVAASGIDYDVDVVKYSVQTLTTPQSTRARTNISAVGKSDINVNGLIKGNGSNAWSLASPAIDYAKLVTLWEGTWTSGAITVAGINNHTLFLVKVGGTMLICARVSTLFRGGNTLITGESVYTIAMSATISGTTVTLDGAKAVTHVASGTHSAYSDQTITGIYALAD